VKRSLSYVELFGETAIVGGRLLLLCFIILKRMFEICFGGLSGRATRTAASSVVAGRG
jgi:hypothetical protein